jgi:hypothetical protein
VAYDDHIVQASLFCSEQASWAAASCMTVIPSSSGMTELDEGATIGCHVDERAHPDLPHHLLL